MIRITPGDRAIKSVDIQARQHLRASRVLEGKTPDEALSLLPLIYHVCARAHGFAARQAFAAAQGTTMSYTLMHQLLVLAETCREHARRVYLDWPTLCGQKPDTGTVLEIQQGLQRIEESAQELSVKPLSQLQSLLQQQLQDLQGLLGPLSDELDGTGKPRTAVSVVMQVIRAQGMASLGSSKVPGLCIHEVDAGYLAEQMRCDGQAEFIAAPHLREQLYETGPLARMRDQPLIQALSAHYANGLLTRFCAMVLELSLIPQTMLNLLQGQDPAWQQHQFVALGPESGMGGVEAARGFLWHRVEMVEGRIKRYQILAPTEWNFHPRGALFRGLQGLRFQSKAQIHELAGMITTALDPCVACALEVA